MSRQRLRPSIRESTTETCPRCMGRGRVRIVESMALQMLTRMEDFAEAGKGPVLLVQVPKDTGEYLMNNKRNYVNRTEEIYEVQINLQIRPDLEIPHYRIERQWMDDGQQRIEVLEDTMKGKKPARGGRKLKPSTPIVGIPTFEDELPPPEKEEKGGLLTKIGGLIFGSVQRRREEAELKAEEERKAEEKRKAEEERAERNRNRRRGGRRRGGRGRRPATEGGAQAGEAKTQEKTSSGSTGEERKDGDKPTQKRRPRNRKSADEKTQAADKPAGNDAVAQEAKTEDGKSEGNGSKRRRRRRRPRRPAGENGAEQKATQGDAGKAGEPAPTPAATPAPASGGE